ncbi:MAG: hypothetical protein FWD84_00635 [Oscillospiraceae bacterium]|nr:hypothetical protein [Oscillospiraceae bacterium]
MEEGERGELHQRVDQLEKLAWSLFRALETYITYNDLRVAGEVRESNASPEIEET